MVRFTIRDAPWLTALTAMGVVWRIRGAVASVARSLTSALGYIFSHGPPIADGPATNFPAGSKYNPGMASAPSPVEFRKCALIGGVLPVIVAVVNERVLADITRDHDSPLAWLVCFAVLLEIAVFGFLFAKHVKPRVMQWLSYAWLWVVLDITVIPLVSEGLWWAVPFALLLPAVLTAQLGVIASWTLLGTVRRRGQAILAVALVLLGILLPLSRYPHHQVAWLVVPQVAVLVLTCGCLRIVGYRLIAADARETATVPTRQFTLFDLLLSTTLLAALLAGARALGVRSLLYRGGADLLLLTGIAAALISTVVLWLVLGKPRTRRGDLFGALMILGMMSITIAVLFAGYVYPPQGAVGSPWSRLWIVFWRSSAWTSFFSTEWPLIAWLGLSPVSLAAALVFPRLLDYRLCRVGRWC